MTIEADALIAGVSTQDNHALMCFAPSVIASYKVSMLLTLHYVIYNCHPKMKILLLTPKSTQHQKTDHDDILSDLSGSSVCNTFHPAL